MDHCIESTEISEEGFWNAIKIFIDKPHVVNKRLWGSKHKYRLNLTVENNRTITINENRTFESVTDIDDQTKVYEYLNKLHICTINNSVPLNCVEVILSELLPKIYSDAHAFQLTCLLRKETKAIFYDVTPLTCNQNLSPNFAYSIELANKQMMILRAASDINSKSYQWLITSVMPQLTRWGGENGNLPNKSNICSESLSLVKSDKYYEKYNDMKIKYGKEMVKIWPECTDPSKFVYEDIAIATYLLLLWEEERLKMGSKDLQSFVDLGCGNGLLVYILASEGHSGVGIDVRKRNIWDMYPDFVNLAEKTITPSDSNLFPDTDWIIGNHSDELTPWIPVISLRSSYKCRFFLLPCCAYNFDGSKYQRQNSSKSQYTEYLEYVKQISHKCGFDTEIDRLKIPSTKRVCLVGRSRLYVKDEHSIYCNKAKLIINSNNSLSTNKNCWIPEFKARESSERVKNCTQLNKNLVQCIVNHITKYLLNECDKTQKVWSPGKSLYLHELVQEIPSDLLKQLKAECGGLQTLLKNNHHIFNVQKGRVQLRYPKTVSEVNSNRRKTSKTQINVKKKPCWFYNNHPQGCPLSNENCSFIHIKI